MGIQVGDNFDHKSKKPLDGRISYATLAAMKAVVDATMYEGCIAYCEATDKYYKFKSTNTVDETTGKWREYNSGGGGGASSLNDLSDVDIDSENLEDGQVLKYNAQTEKFENANGGSATVAELGDIEDVDLDNLEDGQTIVWDAANSKWVNGSASGGASELNDLDDVAVSSPSSGDILKYNSSTQKFENVASGGEDVVRGYAYAAPVTSMEDFIARLNEITPYQHIDYLNGIFNNKPANAACIFQTNKNFYCLFSEFEFDISAMQVTQDGTKKCSISRMMIDGSSHKAYREVNTMTTGITSLTQVNVAGSWEFDTVITDSDKTGLFFVTGNVGFDDRYGSYNDNTYILDDIDFYSDSAHTQKITPVAGKEYFDIPTGKTYTWDGKKYVLASTTDYSEMTNKPKINGVELDGNKTSRDLHIDSYTAGDGIDITEDVIAIDPMPAEDMSEVIDIRPSGGRVAVTGYVPLGTLISYYGETAPRFFLACDGATYNKVDYPELAEHLLSLTNHSQYEVDGDDTKFKVPDLRGEFVRGTGANSHDNCGNGASVGVHQGSTAFPYLYVNEANKQVGMSGNTSGVLYVSNNDKGVMRGTGTSKWVLTPTGASSGGPSADWDSITVRPTNTSVLFCIAYKDIYSNPMNDYSTDEKVVGTWIDGKPIYQKTITGIQMPSVTTDGESVSVNYTFSDLGMSNIQEVIDYDIAVIHSSHHIYKQNHFSYDNTTKTTTMLFNVWVTYSSNEYKLSARNVMTSNNNSTIRITIQYTKTT